MGESHELRDVTDVGDVKIDFTPNTLKGKGCVGPLLFGLGVLVIVGVVVGLVCGLSDSCKICKSVDGGWSEYGDWSECTKTCGGGTQYTNRTCTEPVPNSCGSNCTGDASKVRDCNVDPCPCSKVTVQNGTLDPDQSTYKSGDSFEVICYSGYSPEDVSLATVTCTDGELSDIPACSPDPCDKPEIENGEVIPTNSATVNSGESFYVLCSSGYSLSDASLSALTCTTGALSTQPTCEPDPCDKPEIEKGVVSPTSATINSGESYEVTCFSGYSLSDPSLSTLTCTTGSLSTQPTCEPDPCDQPEIENGILSPTSATPILDSGESYEVFCSSGYSLSDISLATLTCTTGTLSTPPTCEPDPCDKPEIENGVVSPTSATVNSGESYEVTCSSGHSLSNPSLSTLTCTAGALSTQPTCEPDPCNKPAILNGAVEPDEATIDSGSDYTVSCEAAFYISDEGLRTISCTAGELSSAPTCEPARSDRLQNEIVPAKVEHSYSLNNDDTTYSPAHATDLDWKTSSGTDINPADGQAPWFKAHLDQVYCIDQVVEYDKHGSSKYTWSCSDSGCEADCGADADCNSYVVEVTVEEADLLNLPEDKSCKYGDTVMVRRAVDEGFEIREIAFLQEPGYCKVPVIDNGKLSPEWPTIRSGAELAVTCNPYFSLSDESISKVTCTDGVLSELPSCELTPCPDCVFDEGWKTNSDETLFTATKEGCGTLLVNSAENYLSIKSTEESQDAVVESYPEEIAVMNGLNKFYLTIAWRLTHTMKSNETLKMVFSDTGGQRAFGNFDEPLFTSNELPLKYELWTTEDSPTYLPFYLSRSYNSEEDIAACMFADAKGAPIEISRSKNGIEWLIYSNEEVKFYIFNGQTVQDALDSCVQKWKEIYPGSGSSVEWTDYFIVGSLTPSQIKTDQENSESPATHYILSPDSVTMTDASLLVKNGGEIADYSNIIMTVNTRQLISADSDIAEQDLTPENGFYPSISAADTYILDFENSYIQSKFENYLSSTDAGFLLSGGNKLDLAESEDCTKYFYCSDPSSYGADTCLSADFGQNTKVFERQNFYDVSKRGVLKPQNSAQKLVIDTIASPGAGLFFRTDLELTVAGLKTCYNNIFNLRRFGIGAVTCNMCAGVVPSTDSQKSTCFTWSQLSLLMPYVIISSEEDLTGALGNAQNDGFAKLRENFAVRKQLFHYLAKPDISVEAKSNGILLGDNVFMVVNLEGSSGDIEVELPSGQWLAPDPEQQTEGTYRKGLGDGSPQTIAYEESISKLLFYKLENIFVLRDKDNEEHLEVHVMQVKEENFESPITSTFTVDGHETVIKLDFQEGKVTFTYTAGTSSINKDKFKVSKLVIYYWNVSYGVSSSARSYTSGARLVNVVFEYAGGNNVELDSIFSTWSESIISDGS